MLVVVMCGVLGSKALLEGPGSYPSYGAGGRQAIGAQSLVGFQRQPQNPSHQYTKLAMVQAEDGQ